jgi:hypothetical protein
LASQRTRTLKIQFGPFPILPRNQISRTFPTLTGRPQFAFGSSTPSLRHQLAIKPQTHFTARLPCRRALGIGRLVLYPSLSLIFQLPRSLSYFIFRAFNIRSPSFPQSPSPTRPVLGLSSQFPNKIFPAPPP